MWIVLSLLAGQANAQETPFSLAGEGESKATSGVCSTSVAPVVATASDGFSLPTQALMELDSFEVQIVGEYGLCTVRLDEVELRLDGALLWRLRLSLAAGSGRPGSYEISRNSPEIPAFVAAGGDHEITAVVRGRVGSVDEKIRVSFRGGGSSWRDRDRDGVWDLRLQGGEDCDDDDAEVYPGALDFPDDGVDADCDGSDGRDTDNDGIYDAYEVLADTAVDRRDSDDDTVSDFLEWGPDLLDPWDTDQDGTIDALDTDSDDDGWPDKVEVGPDRTRPRDTDGDGIPDLRDDDDDGDGLLTRDEHEEDIDFDGLPGHLDPDSDGDGALDGAEGTGDADNDGIPNFLDSGGDDDLREPAEPGSRGFGVGCASAPVTPSLWVLVCLGLMTGWRRRR
jgi:hypothetical protein